ncbi:MAG: AmmeMemoRadiSam system protein B [Methyloversatilis sp.]|jgi:AmmeMemoRadiSam system protein B/AmmeMemoRadiSam system protein A|nr:AmmeMemoRadiSam system protein B [Methyloversatilis sp.]MBP6195525.1 AmmeMemoRadiSam system protein B [Methyloversatilis sp.]MBP9118316.1 AmmeMemoRadiSam system protein B [Methyloversatilis sp.]
MNAIRPAAVAGTFYPADPRALRDALASHLASAAPFDIAPAADWPPKMLVLPHAGYMYSGDVAALGYAPLVRWRECITRVVLLGPVHRVAVRGLAAPTVGAFETPLGRVPLDTVALDTLGALRQVVWSDLPHAQEHSLEVHLPFLQAVLGTGFTLVPLAVGNARPDEVAEVLERVWGGDETLIVISSDLSHFLPYAQAQMRDRATVQRILHFASDLHGEEACGAAPLNGALRAAKQHGLVPRLLGLCNSGDSAGDRVRVVGYGAIAFDPPKPEDGLKVDEEDPDDAALGRALVGTARHTIAEALGLPVPHARSLPDHPALGQPGATFVTLHDAEGGLRGCIGRLEACRALGDDVRANAHAAAFADPRFAPLRAHEWHGIQVEVSLLDAPEPLIVRNEAEALAALRPGVDGVIFEWREARATFLPQVWAQLPDPARFVAALKRKAGLAADFWAADVRLSRYRVRSFSHHDSREPAGDATS